MHRNNLVIALLAGIAGGFVGNGVLGALFTSTPIHALLYNPTWQSPLFMEITPQRNIPVSVSGLVLLSAIHGWLFELLKPSMPGRNWLRKGLFWGMAIWALYWLFQEWFIYHTLLQEPLLLNLLELIILLLGSLMEGVVIAFLLARPAKPKTAV